MSFMTSCYHIGPCIDGTGPVIDEVRAITDFYGVSNTTSFDVYVSQADEYSVTVSAQDGILPYIETVSSGGTLIVRTADFTCIRSTSSVEVYITLPEIEELNLTGSGQLVCDRIVGDFVELTVTSSGRMQVDSVFCNELNLRNTGSGNFVSRQIETGFGDIRLTGSGQVNQGIVFADELVFRHTSSGTIRGSIYEVIDTDISLTGSGTITLDGETDVLTTSHTSSGRIDALDLPAIDVMTHSTGSGNTYVNVSGILDVSILGSGDVIYTGVPTEIVSRVTGSGRLRVY